MAVVKEDVENPAVTEEDGRDGVRWRERICFLVSSKKISTEKIIHTVGKVSMNRWMFLKATEEK